MNYISITKLSQQLNQHRVLTIADLIEHDWHFITTKGYDAWVLMKDNEPVTNTALDGKIASQKALTYLTHVADNGIVQF